MVRPLQIPISYNRCERNDDDFNILNSYRLLPSYRFPFLNFSMYLTLTNDVQFVFSKFYIWKNNRQIV